MAHVLTDPDGNITTTINQPAKVSAATRQRAIEIPDPDLEPPAGYDPQRHRHVRRLQDGQVVHELIDRDEQTGQHYDPDIGARHA